MKKPDIGRNDPCPCGSGRKYKYCCLGKESGGSTASESADDFADNYSSDFEDWQAEFGRALSAIHNQEQLDDFNGLSPHKMHQFLYYPFDSPQLVTFSERLDVTPTAPILGLFNLLVQAIGEKGLKPTAKGNLPRKVCRESALNYLGEDGYRDRTLFGGINKEEDFPELHCTRLVAGEAGLIRKYRGRFILGRSCRKLVADEKFEVIYPLLLRTYATTFNWAYLDYCPEVNIIQGAFLYSLYLLVKYGDTPRPQKFYEDCFLRAFPSALEEVEYSAYATPEEEVRTTFTRRTLIRFFEFFGLANAKPLLTGKTYGRDYLVTKLPLADEVVRFHFDLGDRPAAPGWKM